MPERRRVKKVITARQRMTEKLGPVFEYGSIIASAPAGGTIAGFKIASKVKKVYDTLASPKASKKPTIADKTVNFHEDATILPIASPPKAPSRPAPQPAQPAPLSQMERQQRRRQYRGY